MSHRLDLMGQPKYAGLTVLNGKGDRHFNGVVRTHEDTLTIPLKWKKGRRIFVNSMSDLFHKDVPFDFVDKVFAVMALCPQHVFQVLTKRPERMAEYLAGQVVQHTAPFLGLPKKKITMTRGQRIGQAIRAPVCELAKTVARQREWSSIGCQMQFHAGHNWPLSNVWLGTSTENQAAANERIPHLLKCPAAVRFISAEPLLGPVDFCNVRPLCGEWTIDALRGERCYLPTTCIDETGRGIDWVIVGGESGPKARMLNVRWIHDIVAQCKAASVPCFLKQLGSLPSDPCDPRNRIDRANNLKYRLFLADRKGGDMNEFPEELRVRQMPKGSR